MRRSRYGDYRSLGIAWVLMWVALAVHVIDEALTGFLLVYNPTVLALRAEKTTRRGGIYARDVLRAVGSRILGVVVNDVPRKKGIYGYYYTEAEVYTYGYGASNRKNANGAKAKANGAETAPAKELV